MIFQKSVRFFMIFMMSAHLCVSVDTVQLSRVTIPQKAHIYQEKSSMNQRQMKRYFVKFGTTAGILVMMYATYKASEYFKDMNRHIEHVDQRVAGIEQKVKIELPKKGVDVLQVIPPVSSQSSDSYNVLAPIKMVAGGVKSVAVGTKNFVRDIGKCMIESSPTFITGMVLTSLWQSVVQRIVEASKQESISWYIDNHTQLWPVCSDLKSACVPFDIHSELLSLQQVGDKSGVQVKAFVSEIVDLVKDNKESGLHDGYLEHCCDELKKSYAKKGDELEQLQDYAAPNIAKKKRAVESGLGGTTLFATEEMTRQNIVDLCNMLTQQIQKVAAFAMVLIDNRRDVLEKTTVARGEKKVAQLITITNNYLDAMELLLNMNLQDLEAMSVANKGLFTCTYEFEKLFREYVSTLNRYCVLIK